MYSMLMPCYSLIILCYGTVTTALLLDTNTYTDTMDTDTDAACKLYFVNHMSYISCFDDICACLT